MNIIASTRLYFTEGRSDKEYHAEIARVSGGHVVNFRYGRRGGTLTSGCKTLAPVDVEAAHKIFDQLVKDKTAKGYTVETSGLPYQNTEASGRVTDFRPQLLNPISEEEARLLIRDEQWIAQPKLDGERRAAQVDTQGVIGMNRKGLIVPLPKVIADELAALCFKEGECRVDGELLGETLHVFDLHRARGKCLQRLPWEERMRLATALLKECHSLKAVPVALTIKEKTALWYGVQAANGEGVVFKRADGVITPGRPNSGGDWLKFKFTSSASCLVMAINEDKRSVRIGVSEGIAGAASPGAIPVGNVTIPTNYPMPSAGQVVEVSYLYAFPGGSLYQPVYRGERSDLSDSDCTRQQLKFKPA